MNVILLAPPAAGKGTQAKILSNKYALAHLSTGELLREAAKKPTALGKELSTLLGTGCLVEDEIVFEVLEERMKSEDCKKGFVLDGFPRNLSQAKALERILQEINKTIDYVFLLDTEKEILKKRITGRRLCEHCGQIYNINDLSSKPKEDSICDNCHHELTIRTDDTEEVYERRYKEYLEKTEPLISYYRESHTLHSIDCNQSIENITKGIDEILRKRDDLND